MNGQAPPLQHRYEQLRLLGRGGAGAVYLVRDRETGEQLALKRLLRADTQSVLRLKREFRSLADIHHPNLVELYELGQDQTSAFFTMEYLAGEELKSYLERGTPPSAAANDNLDTSSTRTTRVLGAFQQLAGAVHTLHRAGVLHRDLKPSNVMVVDGRVVVLDFGIALEVGDGAATITQDKLVSGTPAYMAPEQIQGVHLGEQNDWYAFGVMLYEALSGSLPFEAPLLELLRRKTTEDPRPIATLVPGLPEVVSELCRGLLRRAPEERPSGAQVLSVLQAWASAASTPTTASTASSEFHTSRTSDDAEPSLFGREPELAALWSAFRSVQAGGFAAVHVAGESGSGKSLLLQHFADDVERNGFLVNDTQPLVLRSRCYERETLPFKALDGVMDALVNYLLRESDLLVSHALPRDIHALAQLFPTLNRLGVMRRLMDHTKPLAVTPQARAQAESALAELLRRLGSQRPIVLWIDDLQWGDLDSIGIVTSWLKPPLLPHVLLVLSYRSEEVATSPCLTMLRQRAAVDPGLETMISLPTLGNAHVRALCQQRFELAQVPVVTQTAVIEHIVREAEGSPFLASQLASLAVTRPSWGVDQLAHLTLQQLVRSRSSTLSPDARRLLNVLSVAGRPISLLVALRSAGIERHTRAVIHELQALHLIRTRDSAADRLLEVYHDRLREVVQSMLSPEERLALDQGLLAALRSAGSTDNDWLHALALATGERAAALRYGLTAAERASEMLAFERAAELYARCLTLSDDPAADGGVLWQKLAVAYAHAERGAKAAEAYLQAAKHAGDEWALRFERAAASHFLCSGQFEAGEALLLKVLARLRLEAPTSEPGLYAAVAWERTRAAVRGLRYTPRDISEIPFEVYYGAELCGLLSMETAAYDPLRAALYQARCLRLALDAGEPEGVGRALCAAATMACVSGSERGGRRAQELLALADEISARIDSARLRINIASARAICVFLSDRLAEAVELCAHAEHLHRTSTVDAEYHHRFTLASARIGALYRLSEFRSGETELLAYLKEAAATENISAQLHISMAQAWADEIADRGEQALARLDAQREQLPRRGFGLLHLLHMIAVLRTGCVTGHYDWAISSTELSWQTFQRSVVRRSEAFSMFAYEAHARLLLNRCARDGTARDARHLVAAQLKALAASPREDAKAEHARLEARIAFMQGDRVEALRQLKASSARFEACAGRDQVARNRYAVGLLTGGEAGQIEARAAHAYLSALGIADPKRELRGYFPELLEAPP